MGNKQTLTKDLLEIKAVQINPKDYYTWTSGIKSPIYCDNRLTMSYPSVRKKIAEAFAKKIMDLSIKPDVIAGCATAGIPHAAWLADELQLPMIYVRSKPKGHGKGNQIEGKLEGHERVLLIEDLISTGGSSIQAAQAVQRAGAEVISVFAIFSYGLEKAEQNFAKINLPYQTLTNFDELIELLIEEERINEIEKQELLGWRNHLT